ncbi:MAG: thioredoxin domain-containing protein [Myxococcaceae bacterium]|nr:thioredoxin domain-containing protein [Myxococcaceae bacterium]
MSPARLFVVGCIAACTCPSEPARPAADAGLGNRLARETSPYLLQHAQNPVDWYPWGEEAFARARRENKPVLVSIGYSTCHWCHVMARETFENAAFAAWLNASFIAIKVDREERPDVDAVYLAAARELGSGGGWPLNVVVTPSREVFWAATYVPTETFLKTLQALHAKFIADPYAVALQSGAVTAALRERAAGGGPRNALPGVGVLTAAASYYAGAFDTENGGLRGAPKFPATFPVRFLLRYARRFEQPQVLPLVEKTLEKLAAGGIYDHVGGGFHRYSTDARWLKPHFEKTLYDNALLPVAYLEAYQVTGRATYARVARETLDWVSRELSTGDGAFASATDADSQGVEGRYFLWSAAELDAGPYYAVAPPGVVWVPAPDEAKRFELTGQRAVRSRRVAPARDDKVVTSWNGLAISAFAIGARVLGEPRYLEAARRAARRVQPTSGPLVHTGKAEAVLEDYTFLIQGLLDLYEADFDVRWVEHARALQAVLDRDFADAERGGYFRTAAGSDVLLVRGRCEEDVAEPCGNSVAALNLVRLAALTGESRYAAAAEQLLAGYAETLARDPAQLHELLLALDWATDPLAREVAVVGEEVGPFTEVLRQTFAPNRVTWAGAAVPDAGAFGWLEGKRALGGATTAYVCSHGRCELPAKTPALFREQLGQKP